MYQGALDESFPTRGPDPSSLQFLGTIPKNRTDLLPHYARFAAILNKYMPDIGIGLIAILDEEFKYLQRKRLVAELESVRLKVSAIQNTNGVGLTIEITEYPLLR